MQVTRQRRTTPRSKGRFTLLDGTGRRFRLAIAGTAALAVAGGGFAAYASTVGFGHQQVGQTYASGEQISSDQILKPLGDRLMTPLGKFMGSTVSPDGKFFAATSTDHSVTLQVFNLGTYKPVSVVGTPAVATGNAALAAAGLTGVTYVQNTDGTVGQEGPVFSPDGTAIYVPVSTGVEVYPFDPSTGVVSAGTKISIPDATIPPTDVDGATTTTLHALTGGLAFSPDGSTLYAAVNGQNTVVAINPATKAITATWNVGIAPRHLTFVGNKLYVSNEGGRTATSSDSVMGSYGTQVPADGYKGTSVDGTVSVINTAAAGSPVGTIKVGLHPTRTFASGHNLYVANTNSDTVSVIDTTRDKVVQTIDTQPWSGSDTGYEPSGITVQGGHLIVSLGRANALAVYALGVNAQDPVRYIGLVPTDYYPENVFNVGGQLVVSNRRGIDARGVPVTSNQGASTSPAPSSVTGPGTHSTTASLTRLTLPSDRAIRDTYTRQVFEQNGWTNDDVQQAHGRRARHLPAVAVPRRIGDPSTIKHVFMIVKENRTYDQVYGDMAQGNGDAAYAQFGQTVTPNQHALASQFGLYDNTYDVGTNSAEGHNWLMEGDNPEYTESSAGEYTRSYDTEEDVLGHARSGFLWTAIEDAGKTAKNFGEYLYMEGKPAGTWQQYYCASKSVMAGGDPAQLTAPGLKGNYGSVIPSLNDITDPLSPPFDTSIPDIYRAQIWKQDFEKNGPADFNMLWFSSDHTSGQAAPVAQVADNDLAVGQVVDEISHSKYWKDSAIFVVEDDSQAGVDHVDGHRAPIQVISPWAQHGKTISTYYSQISMDRTIEQILGAQPLNQKIAAATPMYDAFTSHANMTPFTAVPNQVPLTQGLTGGTPTCGNDTPSGTTASTTAVPAGEGATAEDWTQWVAKQHTTGNGAKPDYAAPALMNRYTWYASHDYKVPYPGDTKVLKPSEVPGAYVPSDDND